MSKTDKEQMEKREPTPEEQLTAQTEQTSKLIIEAAEKLADRITHELDRYIEKIRPLIFAEQKEDFVTMAELETIVLKIPLMLYWIGANREKLATKEDTARKLREIRKHFAYVNAAGSVTDKRMQAEFESDSDYMVELTYKTAHCIVNEKMAYALELLNSAKKAISRRMGTE